MGLSVHILRGSKETTKIFRCLPLLYPGFGYAPRTILGGPDFGKHRILWGPVIFEKKRWGPYYERGPNNSWSILGDLHTSVRKSNNIEFSTATPFHVIVFYVLTHIDKPSNNGS